MNDIAPSLLEAIRKDFLENLEGNKRASVILQKIRNGKATYEDAGIYAEDIGAALADAFAANLSSETLPDGKMYWNIADRVVRPMLEQDHQLAADAAAEVQQHLNEAAGLGLKAQTAPVNEERVEGILNKLCAEEQFDDVAWMLGEPVKTFSREAVDETLRRNVEFQGKAGMAPKIIRRAAGHCCEWCSRLAGTYSYPDTPQDVYRRHDYCRCVVEYDPGDGRRQNVHTKQWTEDVSPDRIEERRQLRVTSDVFLISEYEQINALQGRDNAVRSYNLAKTGGRHSGIYQDAVAKSKKQLQRSIISHTEQVERHADKIAHPEQYDLNWAVKTPQQRTGLLKKWRKDMDRNAEQANVEIYTWKERFGNGSE